jgi:hypothetical protein
MQHTARLNTFVLGSLCLCILQTGFPFFDKPLDAFSAVFENVGDDEAITDKNSLWGKLSIRKRKPCVKKRPPKVAYNMCVRGDTEIWTGGENGL